MNSSAALARCLAPIDVNTFLDEYWEQKALVVSRNDPQYFADLISTADIDHILSSTDLRVPAFRLVKEGAQIPISHYTKTIPMTPGAFEGVADVNRVYAEYENGATIVLQALERSWTPLIELCQALEHFFGHPVQANLYFTPANAQGFAAHYDTHDTLILQIEGKKRWKIYDAPFPLPLPKQKYERDKIKPGAPEYDFTLNAGDTIYMPRGVVHEALTSDSYSLHITLGIKVKTWFDALSQAVSQALTHCEQDIAFRKALPLNFASVDGAVIEQMLRELLQTFHKELNPSAIHERLAEQFVMTRAPYRPGQLLDLHRLNTLDLNSRVARRENILFRIRRTGDRILLAFHGKRISFPAHLSAELEFVTAAKTFRVRDLPGNLDDASKLVLVKRLIREGFLTLRHIGDSSQQ